MTVAADFLISLGHVLSAAGLYGVEHPAYRSARERAFRSLSRLLDTDSNPRFSFLDAEVIFANRRLREVRDWPWAETLVRSGAERIEFSRGLEPAEFDQLLEGLLRTLDRERGDREPRRIELPHARVGPIAKEEAERLRESDDTEPELPRPDVDEETQAIDYLFDQASSRGLVSLAVARAVIQSLSVVLQYGRPLMELLVPVRSHDEYTTVHSLNVSTLSMGLAEAAGVPRNDIRSIGEAALLHDLGTAVTPTEVLQKPGKLTPEEWDTIKKHPEDGAKMILRSGAATDFAAVVAYEHHLTWQGGGYPKLRYPRRPHPVSQMVQICDIFDALRTERPFRGPWPVERILAYFGELSGSDLNPDVLAVFDGMLRRQEGPGPEAEGSEAHLGPSRVRETVAGGDQTGPDTGETADTTENARSGDITGGAGEPAGRADDG